MNPRPLWPGLISAKTRRRTPATLAEMGAAKRVLLDMHRLRDIAEAQVMQENSMRLRLEVILMMLSAAMPTVFAADASNAPATHALVHDSQGQPVLSSSGECWHSSITASQDAAFASGCRAPSAASAAVSPSAGPAEQARTQSAGAATQPTAIAAGAGQQAATASGSGPSSAAYVTDSRGIVVRSSTGDCWRTGSWTPAQATVVGCDGVLARALPVPAPAEPGKTEAGPQTPAGRESATPSNRAAPVAPVAPSPPGPATAAPGGTPREALANEPEPRSEKVTFDTDTFFDFDKAVLKPDGKAKLDTLAARLGDSKVEVVVAVGHADATGPAAYNQRLSERRARAVIDYLEQKGLPREKIFSEGRGETQPVASNATKAGRAKNRRVEVEVVAIRSKK